MGPAATMQKDQGWLLARLRVTKNVIVLRRICAIGHITRQDQRFRSLLGPAQGCIGIVHCRLHGQWLLWIKRVDIY
ncbi:hypothetical protein GL58_03270 [Comamonas testosteroni]|uniref:Uncharacterized protein n=1 Tax=Comamonas testosteroni TaxID=285 RepID=A0A0L7MPY5_COMTE|nr:hypothetical protein GL58_03270 [Comamonas testosteroni]